MRILLVVFIALLCQASSATHARHHPSSPDGVAAFTSRSLSFFYNQQYRARDLRDAINNDDLDLFFTILECECVNLEETDEFGETALHAAVRKLSYDMTSALVEAGADVNAQGFSRVSPLHISCFNHLTNVTVLLLENGANVNSRTDTDERPIIQAQTLDDVELLRILITAGAEINFQDGEGESPLHEASAYGAARNAEFLIERGADLTVREQGGRTPAEFICACREFDERRAAPCFDNTCQEDNIADLERVFRRAERRESAANDNRITNEDLWLAIVNGTVSEIDEILASGFIELQAITQSDTDAWVEGQTALHLAVLAERLPVCEVLIEAGARPDAGNAVGDTPLHLATRGNLIDIIELILSQDVNVDDQNDAGETALHIASHYGFIQAADLLMRNGATRDINDEQGATSIEILCSCLLDADCPTDSCRDGADIEDMMVVLNEENEVRQQEVVELYFPSTASLTGVEDGEAPDEDDGASSLGTFIGVLFACALVFFVIYLITVIHMRQRSARQQLAQRLNQPGPSNGPAF